MMGCMRSEMGMATWYPPPCYKWLVSDRIPFNVIYLSQSSVLPHSHSFVISASYLCLYHPQREADGMQFSSPSLFLLACLCHWLVSSCSWSDTRTAASRRSFLALDQTARHQQTLQGSTSRWENQDLLVSGQKSKVKVPLTYEINV